MASTDRRGVLKVALAGGAVALCAATVAPAIAFVLPARGAAGGRRWVRTVPLDALTDGVPFKVKIITDERDAWKLEKDAELGAVWLTREGESVTALSVVCPHLGCAIGPTTDSTGFACPCHDSTFDSDGKRRNGPSPRDMDPLETRVVEGVVEVDFRRFKQNVPERVQIG